MFGHLSSLDGFRKTDDIVAFDYDRMGIVRYPQGWFKYLIFSGHALSIKAEKTFDNFDTDRTCGYAISKTDWRTMNNNYPSRIVCLRKAIFIPLAAIASSIVLIRGGADGLVLLPCLVVSVSLAGIVVSRATDRPRTALTQYMAERDWQRNAANTRSLLTWSAIWAIIGIVGCLVSRVVFNRGLLP